MSATISTTVDRPIAYDRLGNRLLVSLAHHALDRAVLANEALPVVDADIASIDVDLEGIDQVNSVLISWLVRLAATSHRPVRILYANNRVRVLLTQMRLQSILTIV